MLSPLKRTLSVLCSIFIMSSCGSLNETENKEEQIIPVAIVDKGIKSFPLDYETTVDFNSRFRVNNFEGKEYLSFANRPTSRVYEFDYATGEQTRKIMLQKEGPNRVNLFFNIGIFFHSKDSIFIDGGGFGYYLLNGAGEVLSKAGMAQKENTLDPDCCPISFTSASFYKDEKVFGSKKYNQKDDKKYDHYSFGSIDFRTDAQSKELLPKSFFIPEHREIIEMERAKDPWVTGFKPSFYSNDNLLYAASPISDTVHVFKDFELVDKYSVTNPQIALTDYRSYLLISRIEQAQNGFQKISQTNQPPHFADVFVSPDGNLIYRILIETTKGRKVETLDYEIPEVAKASLIVFDKTLQKTTTFSLPVDELEIPLSVQSRSIFVSIAGIHFQTKEQISEDRLDFRLFGIE